MGQFPRPLPTLLHRNHMAFFLVQCEYPSLKQFS
uniref:Uncharacterized protein n=1 Tax=Anguilla anguilla TaxID=7936 RepID=A0A0E9W0U5_ANGAN